MVYLMVALALLIAVLATLSVIRRYRTHIGYIRVRRRLVALQSDTARVMEKYL